MSSTTLLKHLPGRQEKTMMMEMDKCLPLFQLKLQSYLISQTSPGFHHINVAHHGA